MSPPLYKHSIVFPAVSNVTVTLRYEVYRRSGFNCEYLLNANCEFFYVSQLLDSQT